MQDRILGKTRVGQSESIRVRGRNNLRFMEVNCRSVLPKQLEFSSLVECYQPDIFIGVESFLDKDILDSEVFGEGYQVFRRDRNRHGGGLFIGVKTGIRSRVEWIEEDVEMMCVEIKEKTKILKVIAVYRPGGNLLLERLADRLDHWKGDERAVIGGDFNLPEVVWDMGDDGVQNKTQALVYRIMNNGFVETVRNGTRVCGKHGEKTNLLDIFLVRPPELWLGGEIVEGISDHQVPILDIELMHDTDRETTNDKKIWLYRKGDEKGFKQFLKQQFDTWCSTEENVEQRWRTLKDILNAGREMFVPTKEIRRNTDPPYYNKSVRRLKRKARAVHRKKSTVDEVAWRAKRKAVREELTEAKKVAKNRYMEGLFDEQDTRGSWSKLYSHIRSLKGSNRSIPVLRKGNREAENDKEKADMLSKQFAGVFQCKEEQVKRARNGNADWDSLGITTADIWKEVKRLKNGKSPGPDGITGDTLKIAGSSAIPFLEELFKISFNTGEMPQEWKQGTVVPIFKEGERSDPRNYRPVSLTSVVCKIMESLIAKYVRRKWEERGGWLSKEQHGFRPGHSCESQLVGLSQDLIDALDKKQEIDCVFIDFEKAFDKVPHGRLVDKLSSLELDNGITDWIEGFLTDRTQKVRVGTEQSDDIKVTSGVPQGSVLGPLLFIAYINDIGEGVKSRVRLFADDLIVYRVVGTEEDTRVLQEDINQIQRWAEINRMKINSIKSQYVRFSRARERGDGNYQIEGVLLERKDCCKYLGLVLDRKMDWGEQVTRVVSKSLKQMAFVMRNLKETNGTVKEKAYMALIRPIAEYAAAVWDPYKIGQVKAVESIQRKAARKVKGKNRFRKWVIVKKDKKVGTGISKITLKRIPESVSEMVEELGWETLEERRKKARLCNIYRALVGSEAWEDVAVRLEKPEYIGRKDHRWKIKERKANTEGARGSHVTRGIRDWNNLSMKKFPQDIAEMRRLVDVRS